MAPLYDEPKLGPPAKHSRPRGVDQSILELEYGTNWNDTYTGNYGHENHNTSVRGGCTSILNTSEERLKDGGKQNHRSGIYKSTSVMITSN